MVIKQNDDLKMETECGEWKQNNKWWKFELKNWDVKKIGNGNVIDGEDGVFKKNIKKIY